MNWWLYVCGGCLLVTSGLLACMVLKCREWHRLADNRLVLLRNLIDKAYVHRNHSSEFARIFRMEIAARNLRNCGIIPPSRFSSASDAEEKEQFLVGLLDAGFSSREVCAIFDLKSVNCFYVKYHRVKKKLSQAGKKPKETTL